MIRLVKKSLLAFLAALVLLSVGAACGATDPAAVTINGTEISVREIDDELEEIRDNTDYRRGIEAGNQAVLGQGEGTVDAAFASRVVSLAAYYELVHQEVTERKLKVSDAIRKEAQEAVYSQFGVNPETGTADPAAGKKIFDKFSKWYRDTLVRRESELRVLQAALSPVDLSDAAIERYYRDNQDRYVEVCAHHVLVNTEPEAVAVKARLDAGEDFVQVAKEISIDPSAAENGGDLGCASPTSYVPEFADAITNQPIGVVGAPVQTQFGFHVIRVDRSDVSSLEDVRAQIENELSQQGSGALNEWLTEALGEAKVKLNPRFGTWDKTATPIPKVNPPSAPTTIGGDTTVPLEEVPLDGGDPSEIPVDTTAP
jgi:foldase protein PrsA